MSDILRPANLLEASSLQHGRGLRVYGVPSALAVPLHLDFPEVRPTAKMSRWSTGAGAGATAGEEVRRTLIRSNQEVRAGGELRAVVRDDLLQQAVPAREVSRSRTTRKAPIEKLTGAPGLPKCCYLRCTASKADHQNEHDQRHPDLASSINLW